MKIGPDLSFFHTSRFKLIAAVLLAMLVASGCASRSDEVLSEQEYYEEARSALEARNFTRAQGHLENLETYYPFGRYAEQAQLDLIYARYQTMDLDGARSAANRFLRLNPQSENADYALYVRGVASYYMDLSLAVRYFPVAMDARDPGQQRQAFQDFSQLLNQFPDSAYAADARQRMIAIRNRLAGMELHAARYYVKREAYMAAANRAQYVVENFPRTPAVEQALAIQTEMYLRLGLRSEAGDTLELLRLNFPESDVLTADGSFQRQTFGAQDRSLLNVVTFGLLGGPDSPENNDM